MTLSPLEADCFLATFGGTRKVSKPFAGATRLPSARIFSLKKELSSDTAYLVPWWKQPARKPTGVSAAGECLRFCEQPPAVVFLPGPAPIRVAVEVVLPSGGRDTNFEGHVQLELHGDAPTKSPAPPRNTVHCRLGLCLFTDLVLNALKGQHRLKAVAVQPFSDKIPGSVLNSEGTPQPAFSAPIVYQESIVRDLRVARETHDASSQDKAETNDSLV